MRNNDLKRGQFLAKMTPNGPYVSLSQQYRKHLLMKCGAKKKTVELLGQLFRIIVLLHYHLIIIL